MSILYDILSLARGRHYSVLAEFALSEHFLFIAYNGFRSLHNDIYLCLLLPVYLSPLYLYYLHGK